MENYGYEKMYKQNNEQIFKYLKFMKVFVAYLNCKAHTLTIDQYRFKIMHPHRIY